MGDFHRERCKSVMKLFVKVIFATMEAGVFIYDMKVEDDLLRN